MNEIQAREYFVKGDLIGFFRNKPAGLQCSTLFRQAMDGATTDELNQMGVRCLQINRTFVAYGGVLETDSQYRMRLGHNSWKIDDAYSTWQGYSTPVKYNNMDSYGYSVGYDYAYETTCCHEWKQYHGLFETDEYCSKCNERKSK